MKPRWLVAVGGLLVGLQVSIPAASGQETVWIEAEHLRGVRGHCFPEMNGHTTQGHWAIAGPGICAEWSQGGESGWLSIACGPEDATAQAEYDLEIPAAGTWRLWVRYRDWRGETERFAVRLEQPGNNPVVLRFGDRPVVDEEDELKLLWDWAFGWDVRELELAKGPARVILLADQAQSRHRQVDCLCLTTDKAYHPRHREKPRHPAWEALERLRREPPLLGTLPVLARSRSDLPAAWKLRSFQDRGLLYLWNMGKPWLDELASSASPKVMYPFHVDEPLVEEFRKTYSGKTEVPIFSDPRIVPTFHASGPHGLDNPHFVAWLEADPRRCFATLLNYTTPAPLSDNAKAAWKRLQDRYVGAVHGESLGTLAYDTQLLREKVRQARNRRDLARALTEVYTGGKAGTEKTVFGEPLEKPYRHAIPCQSSGMTAYAHLCRTWGAEAVGYENTAVFPCLGMRWAFLRGSARQYGGLTANYRSCNFGDAATIYAEKNYFYAAPKYVLDNWYDVFAGAGMTWYKFDIWHSYFAGCSLFYHEQGHDEFWKPGGQAAGLKPLQLSPKGKLVDQFLKLTRKRPERGVPFTPVALLLDPAHGWDPNHFLPTYFDLDPAWNPDLLRYDRHARMLQEWFRLAYHPYGLREAELNTSVNPAAIPGMFGNLFDVLVADPERLDILETYSAVVLLGEIELDQEVGRRLRQYLEAGGTVVLSAGHVSGPGVAELGLPAGGPEKEGDSCIWVPSQQRFASQRFRYHALPPGGTPLVQADNGDVLAAAFPKGQGRLIFLSLPGGLGIDGSATPAAGLVLTAVCRQVMPVQVAGEVEWLVNRTERGWIVTLFNPAGSAKPQHGVVPTDYTQARKVVLTWTKPISEAQEWFTEAQIPVEQQSKVAVEVPAGGVRIVEVIDGS